MGSQIVESILRLRSEGGNIAQLAKDADGAAGGMARLTAAAGIFAASTGIVAGFARTLGSVVDQAFAARGEMVRLGQATEDQIAAITTNHAAVAVMRAEWMGFLTEVASSPLVRDFFTGAAAAIEIATRTIKGEALGSWESLRKEITDTTTVLEDSEAAWGKYWDTVGDLADRGIREARRQEAERQAAEEQRLSEIEAARRERGAGLRAAALFQAQQAATMRDFEAGLGPDGLPLPKGIAANAGLDIAGLSTDKLEEVAEAHKATADEIVGIWGSATGQILSTLTGFFAKNEALQKASAVTSIAISTAAAVMQAFRIYGPQPIGYAAAASMLVVGGLQVAAALAGKMPGGIGGRGIGGRLEDMSAPLTQRELRAIRRDARHAEEAADGGRGGAPRRRGDGGTTIFALNTRELARELRRLGAFNVAVAGE